MNQLVADLGPEPSDKDEPYQYRSARLNLEQLKDIKIMVESSSAEATYASINALDQLEIPDSPTKISIEARGSGYSATVVFDSRDSRGNSYYGVAGNDAQIVNGTATTLRERIEKSAISRIHNIVSRDLYAFSIAGLLVFLITFGIIRFLILVGVWGGLWNRPTELAATLTDSVFLAFVGTGFGGGFLIARFLSWLAPYFTYAEDRANKNRTMVTGIFYVVSIGLIINLLYDVIRFLLSS
jgi:hypothetical protein